MPRFRFRSAITGRFVKALFAKLFPWITVRERTDIRQTHRDTMRRFPKTMAMLAESDRAND